MNKLAIVFVVIGCILVGLGMSMKSKQNAVTRLKTEILEGNRAKNAAIGAGAGAVVGAGAGATIGGIGIAACGTGFGIPVGIVCLIGAGVCALVGGGIGAATGEPDKTISEPITEMVSAYSPFEYWTVIIIGVIMIGIGIYMFLRLKKEEK